MKRLLVIAMMTIVAVQTAYCCSIVEVPARVNRTFMIVLTYDGKPLQMPVSVSDPKTGKVIQEVTTDRQGSAKIHDLAFGVYKITTPVSETDIEVVPDLGTDTLHISAMYDREPVEVASVNGAVKDPSGAVIPEAVAVLEALDTSHSPVAVGTSDKNGFISLKAPDSVYLLRVARQGFFTAVVPVRIKPSGWREFELTLAVGGCPASSEFKIKPTE